MSRLLLLAAFVGAASALTCYTCDSFLTCNDPQIEFCPISTQCYTLRNKGQVTYKGCTAGCASLPANAEPGVECTTCTANNCNSGSATVRSKFEQLQPQNSNPLVRSQSRRSIGHGAGVQQPQIGSGVSGNSGYSAYGNSGGIGSGVGVGSHQAKHGHGIGHGAQPGHGGIGGGAAPNSKKHYHRQRRSGGGWNVGEGARPRSATTTLAFVPLTLAIARLFQ